ncbi:MAG TPA: metal ABC transporter permease [Candidatus Sumerlaeota bacterium]|nr:metal ABC transporter permease [Candidatus Sumerlaeota bacterium]
MLEAFEYAFMQRALIAGLIVAVVCSYFGVFVVQRRMGFLGNGLAHSAFGGVALAILLQQRLPALDPLWIAAPFTVAVALAIQWVQQRSRLASDTAIGILFSLAMALGIIFLSKTTRYSADAMAYLFGSILTVSPRDVINAIILALLTIAVIPLWGRWAYASMDAELARADAVPVARDNYILTAVLAVAIVIAMKIVGIVLIAAFMVIPAATARLLTNRFGSMTIASVLFGAGSVLLGLPLSVQLDMPSGAFIIVLQSAVFFSAMILQKRHS